MAQDTELSAREVLARMRERQRTAAARRRATLRAAGKKSVTVWISETDVDVAKAAGLVPVSVIYAPAGTETKIPTYRVTDTMPMKFAVLADGLAKPESKS